MPLKPHLHRSLSILLPLAITTTIYLYLYPIFHGCAFALPSPSTSFSSSRTLTALLSTLNQHVSPSSSTTETAPFNLLILADPQLEGDTSLPNPDKNLLPRLHHHWSLIRSSINSSTSPFDPAVVSNVSTALREIVTKDISRSLRATRKRVDLLGNDYYLAHVYRTLHWWTRPTHVTVLGDLIGSQWISDGEFESRGGRFWGRVFNGGSRVPDGDGGTGDEVEVLGGSKWEKRIINVAGNHDIGYAGDISAARIERFERMFGRANWDVRFQLQPEHPINSADNESTAIPAPTIHLINLNSLTLDTPALDTDIQSASYAYVNDLIMQRSYPVEDRSSFTLLLTHLPLHKEEGICTDGPEFTFFDDDDDDDVPRFKEGGLKEQNHLSDFVSSNAILQGVFGMTGNKDSPGGGFGRNGLILTGHDHTGCDVVHFVNRSVDLDSDEGWKWSARRYTSPLSAGEEEGEDKTPSIREVTLRSMMGEFGGNAGLLSLWFDADPDVYEWKYEISMCALGVQHIWWAVHVLDLVTLGVLLVYLVLPSSRHESKREEKEVNGEKHSKQSNGHTKTDTDTKPKTVQK